MTPNEIALWEKYNSARCWFDQAVDERNEWRRVAESRHTTREVITFSIVFFLTGAAFTSVCFLAFS